MIVMLIRLRSPLHPHPYTGAKDGGRVAEGGKGVGESGGNDRKKREEESRGDGSGEGEEEGT